MLFYKLQEGEESCMQSNKSQAREIVAPEVITVPATIIKTPQELLVESQARVVARRLKNPATSSKRRTRKEQFLADIRASLLPDDWVFFKDAWDRYIRDYPDLNESSDRDDLVALIFELLFQRQLRKEKLDNPALDITESYGESMKRWEGLKKSLSSRRSDRKKGPGSVNKADIGTLIQVFASEDGVKQLEASMVERKDKLAKFLEDKRIRDKSLGIETEVDC
jgi:hypothetical protein